MMMRKQIRSRGQSGSSTGRRIDTMSAECSKSRVKALHTSDFRMTMLSSREEEKIKTGTPQTAEETRRARNAESAG